MTILLISLALLVGGYCIYGLLVEKVFGIDPKRLTPARSRTDGVDYVELPTWKVFLIQFLNIAGLGPIFGAIMGVMFGPMAFIWIVFGSIFGGAVHDFISAMMSLRSGGDSLPELVGRELGPVVKQAMRFISIVLLVLVGAVFVLTPAGLLDNMTPALLSTNFWIVVIFLYYILATLLPIDKLIGRFYPIFGFVLLFMAVGLLGVMLFGDVAIPDGFSYGLYSRHSAADTHPIFPMMFVSIACGAVSGFHATQSPMMARCLKNEKLARPVFYGAMIAEGLVALIWAAAAIAFTGGYGELSEYMAAHNGAGDLVADISVGWLGTFGGVLAILGVVAAPITTGDTALRSARLIAADVLHIDQSKLMRRLMVSLPLFAIAFGLMCIDFNILWRYFAWTNQLLAAFTLWAATVYLARHRRLYIVTLIPALFMTMVVVSYILVAPSPEGFGLPEPTALYAGAAADGICLLLFARYEVLRRSGRLIHEVSY
ncbi:MAG: carbon starvation protein A [Muribaculaceae bacterium]|jgi:carbon starvation protein CstA|nr:carbon starvation protein A [Muribaculaceae bacterium]